MVRSKEFKSKFYGNLWLEDLNVLAVGTLSNFFACRPIHNYVIIIIAQKYVRYCSPHVLQ